MCVTREQAIAYLQQLRGLHPKGMIGIDYYLELLIMNGKKINISSLRNLFLRRRRRDKHLVLPSGDDVVTCDDLSLVDFVPNPALDATYFRQFKVYARDVYLDYCEAVDYNDEGLMVELGQKLIQLNDFRKITFNPDGSIKDLNPDNPDDYRAVYHSLERVLDIILKDRICMWCLLKSYVKIGYVCEYRGQDTKGELYIR